MPLDLPGIRGAASPTRRLIVYSPSGYKPRDEFTLAHELLELHLPPAVAQLPHPVRERFCDRGAAALLLPRQQFLFSLHGVGWELPELRRRWPWASWGAIASRLVDLLPTAAAATWVNGERDWWRFTDGIDLAALVHLEYQVTRAIESRRGHATVQRSGLHARAWRLVARQGRQVTLTVVQER